MEKPCIDNESSGVSDDVSEHPKRTNRAQGKKRSKGRVARAGGGNAQNSKTAANKGIKTKCKKKKTAKGGGGGAQKRRVSCQMQMVAMKSVQKCKKKVKKGKKVRVTKAKSYGGAGLVSKRGAALFRKWHISNELADFLGVKYAMRHEVTRLIWDYIKKHNLKNENGVVVADEALEKVLGHKSFDKATTMIVYIKHHFLSQVEEKKRWWWPFYY